MEDTKHIQIKDYNYTLPEDRIAKYPVAPRDHSKLLLYRDGRVSEDSFYNLPTYLKPGALMVFNNTKVIFARLHFQKTTGALIEIFCLEPHTPADYQQSFAATRRVTWTCLVGNMKKWKEGRLERTVKVGDRELFLTAEHKGPAGTGFEIAFDWGDDAVSFSEVLDAIGELPIPPYLNRQTEQSDLNNYQTVYSKIEGSVAAPTAGLHFTDDVLRRLDEAGIVREEITLHVGAGTFKPVKSEEIEGHTMHAEWIAVSRQNIEHLLAHDCSCIAVGTTSVRTLESLYYIGVLIHRNPHVAPEDLHVPQWLPYEYEGSTEEKLTPEAALREILAYLDRNNMSVLHTATQIIIAPGYTYKIVKTMVTNFHQPQSTLLLLVSAFVGGDWRAIYDYALAHDFRFLSYGDSSLLNY
ncbi:S-adenosylmethionine:tRNA ribosyltransferase-isomerase [Alloprevotella tannerae]|uniref:S-adenosylmethionine:tRNA ribosyltransferase-isomerase n=1 Tax=Alloprevotella tannerae TaxID=76122 RepID=UPI001EDA188F|nr:S-adenosylmethionine:tRNA ribosyltransferase-isomerase [Alloprevotella tannerae]MCG2652568.1 S-adenosylmethionine:tRNA ribosyltransferase-isomerase [Alloprevotella tannerae]